jgi:glycosyltransferase involved in cell wall biosynthesis
MTMHYLVDNCPIATVTIAIACYNQAQYLAEAIDSILAQTRPVDEIIMVDDGSHDATALVCREYPTVTYHRQENGGLSAARNTGLRLARTSHILFLDADDVLMPTAIADALKVFARAPGIAFAYGGYREVNADRKLIFERLAVEHEDPFAGLLHDNHVSMHGTVLYDVAPLRAIGGFDTSLPSCEDYDVYLKLTRHHRIAAYPSVGAEYRRHSANMSSNAPRMIQTGRRVIERQIDAGGLTPVQLRIAQQGIEFNTRFYSLQMIAELKRATMRPFWLLWTGCRSDGRFPIRLVGAAFHTLAWRLRLTRNDPNDS